MSKLATLSLFPATPDQIIASRKRTFVQWAKGMTLEQYLQRDASLDVMEHAANGNLTTWVLAPRSDPKTLDFKCSCETYLRKGFIVQALEAEFPNGVEIPCYSIASVFTPATKRGTGYAKHMMRLLHWVMASHSSLPHFPEQWGTPPESTGNAKFSVLYSAIGDFYSSCGPREESGEGWTIKLAVETIWDVNNVRLESVGEKLGEWEWLDIPGVDKLSKEETKAIKTDVIQSTKSTGCTSFTFLPGTMVCALIYYVLFSPPLPHMNKWGVVLKDSSLSAKEGDPRTFAIWSVEKGPSSLTLSINCLRATQVTFPHLLRKLLEVAREHDMQTIEVWNLAEELVVIAGQFGGKTEETDNLPAFKWYGDEKAEEVDWLDWDVRVCLVLISDFLCFSISSVVHRTIMRRRQDDYPIYLKLRVNPLTQRIIRI